MPNPSPGTPEPGSLAAHIDALFTRSGVSNRAAAAAINAKAGHQLISDSYLSYLRRGKRANVGHDKLAAIASYFGVDLSQLTGPEVDDPDEFREVLSVIRDKGVRDLARHAGGLSPQSLELLLAMATKLRVAEGLPAICASRTPRNTTKPK